METIHRINRIELSVLTFSHRHPYSFIHHKAHFHTIHDLLPVNPMHLVMAMFHLKQFYLATFLSNLALVSLEVCKRLYHLMGISGGARKSELSEISSFQNTQGDVDSQCDIQKP